jgi:hypothetical protein
MIFLKISPPTVACNPEIMAVSGALCGLNWCAYAKGKYSLPPISALASVSRGIYFLPHLSLRTSS